MKSKMLMGALISAYGLVSQPLLSSSAEEPSPLLPHVGGQITTAFSNRFGPDAESTLTFTAVTPDLISLNYESTRGLMLSRNIQVADRQKSNVYVMGYADNMPLVIPGTTSLGISGASLLELRNAGKTPLSLVYDPKLSKIDGQLTLVEKDIRIPLMIENQVMDVPAVHAKGIFGSGDKTANGDFYFLDNKNNPIMLQSTLQLSWEKQVRSERVVRVTAGASMRSAMEQSLNTLKKYDVYGLHFDFDKATLRPDSNKLIKDIATTLKNNPTWTFQINGHTDNIGEASYNKKLSSARAASVALALVEQGIDKNRLKTDGLGQTQPKGDNATLDGRAQNRRVELIRTDR